ncbi:hypothetical protein [Serinicoccus sp. CNJ-927]|uniref:hypothetical protein n=1 Tax=Serinicoccus sp. CNJ-927 TaxID=1904970 RepID=UPI001EDBBA49|nr:hypothetical protein [Serinicoccus sp. CNJ-927]
MAGSTQWCSPVIRREVDHARCRAGVMLLALGCALLAGCASGGEEPTPRSRPPSTGASAAATLVVVGSGTTIVHLDSQDEIARWASQVLVVTPRSEEPRDHGGAPEVGRDVTVEVDEVIWTAADAITSLGEGQRSTFYEYPAYVQGEGELVPAVEEGRSRLELGQPGVVFLADDVVDDEQGLTLLHVSALEEGQISLAGAAGRVDISHLAQQVDAAALRVDRLTPHPGESLVQRLERYPVQE